MTAFKFEAPDRWANPKLLSWARQQLDLSVGDAAHLTRTRERDLSDWEAGLAAPSLDDLSRLAAAYDCPVGYFFLPTPPPKRRSGLEFRGLAEDKTSTLSYETRLGLRRFERFVEQLEALLEELGRTWEATVPEGPRLGSEVEDVVARAVALLGITPETRSRWSSQADAFRSWRQAIERQGVFVVAQKLTPGDVRGASLWEPGGLPAILVNHADIEAATGRTFTLLHEYAHLLMRGSGIACDFRGPSGQPVERLANRFAAEAIVPREGFIALLRQKSLHRYRERWSDDVLNELREPFKASRDTVAILIEDTGLAPTGFYIQKRKAWERLRPYGRGGSGGVTLFERKLQEFGFNTSAVLASALETGSVSRLHLADLLDLKLERLDKFASWVRDTAKRE